MSAEVYAQYDAIVEIMKPVLPLLIPVPLAASCTNLAIDLYICEMEQDAVDTLKSLIKPQVPVVSHFKQLTPDTIKHIPGKLQIDVKSSSTKEPKVTLSELLTGEGQR